MNRTLVYMLTREDNLNYIGITNNIKARLYQHKKSLRFSLSKIMSVEILADCPTYQEAENLEEHFISKFDTFKNGLNTTPTGKGKNLNCKFNTLGFVFSDETKRKMRENHWSKTGKYTQKGRRHSKESRERMSIARKGKLFRKIKIELEEYQKIADLINVNGIIFDHEYLKTFIKKSQRKSFNINQLDTFITPNGKPFDIKVVYFHYLGKQYGFTSSCISQIYQRVKNDTK